MAIKSNISPFSLLNGKLTEQLFDYTEDELKDFHKAIQPDMLADIFDAVEDEYNIQNTPSLSAANTVANYLSVMTDEQIELFSEYLLKETKPVTNKKQQSNNKDKSESKYIYNSPRVELLEGYIAISSSNLKALDKFKDRVIKSSDIPWEHRIKKHGDVTIHSYVFNIQENSK